MRRRRVARPPLPLTKHDMAAACPALLGCVRTNGREQRGPTCVDCPGEAGINFFHLTIVNMASQAQVIHQKFDKFMGQVCSASGIPSRY